MDTSHSVSGPWRQRDKLLNELCLRDFHSDDDLDALTRLVHEAYAPHVGNGLRFWGTHQSVEDTRKRFIQGHGILLIDGTTYVGTVTVRPPQPDSPVALYRSSDVWSISQFAVSPSKKGCGLGKMLHEAAVSFAVGAGARRMALDTAAPAENLLQMYCSWGYQVVGECDWRPHTNYLSVLLVKSLDDGRLGGETNSPGETTA